jgi:CDP-glycerol glycerophosphotransferase (TagB/SpsB family)
MKVIINCSYFAFHHDFVISIKNEIEKRGGIVIITITRNINFPNAEEIEQIYRLDHPDADFTILPDEACKRISGKGIYINHAIPIVPQNRFYLEQQYQNDVNNNADYLFMPSNSVAEMYKKDFKINKEIRIVGFPKLDYVFQRRKNKIINLTNPTIIYAPTGSWKKNVNSEHIVDIELLKQYGLVSKIVHPADNTKNISSIDFLSTADIIISDYSSIGLESIILNIPTILIDNTLWNDSNIICDTARNASIRVKTMDEIEHAIQKYMNEPMYLQNERIKYGKLLSEYHGNSCSVFVDCLYDLL